MWRRAGEALAKSVDRIHRQIAQGQLSAMLYGGGNATPLLEWNELVHTSYFRDPDVAELTTKILRKLS